MMKMSMENLTETNSLAEQPEVFDFATAAAGFCPPAEKEARHMNLARQVGRGTALSVMLSAAILGFKSPDTDQDFARAPLIAAAPNLPAHKITPHTLPNKPPVRHEEKTSSTSKTMARISVTSSAYFQPTHSQLLPPTTPKQPPAEPAAPNLKLVGQARQGTWVTNKEDGYYVARTAGNDKIKVLLAPKNSSAVYTEIHQSRGKKQITVCGWVALKALSKPEYGSLPSHLNLESPCAKKLGKLANRYSIGKDFNCPPHACVDGSHSSQTHLSPDCNFKVFYNYVPKTGSSAYEASNRPKGLFYDYAGKISSITPIHYRFTTLDNAVAVIRVDGKRNWVDVARHCVIGSPRGGTPEAGNP